MSKTLLLFSIGHGRVAYAGIRLMLPHNHHVYAAIEGTASLRAVAGDRMELSVTTCG